VTSGFTKSVFCDYIRIIEWIIIGSDRRPETKQGIKGKIVRFRSGRVRDREG